MFLWTDNQLNIRVLPPKSLLNLIEYRQINTYWMNVQKKVWKKKNSTSSFFLNPSSCCEHLQHFELPLKNSLPLPFSLSLYKEFQILLHRSTDPGGKVISIGATKGHSVGNGAWCHHQPCKETVVDGWGRGRSVLRIARADLADPRKRDVSIVLQKPVEHVLRPFQLTRDTRMAGDENGSRERERERGRKRVEEGWEKLCLMARITHRRSPYS